jgi:hypothetical protein
MRGAAGHADAAAGSTGSVLRLSKIKANKKTMRFTRSLSLSLLE